MTAALLATRNAVTSGRSDPMLTSPVWIWKPRVTLERSIPSIRALFNRRPPVECQLSWLEMSSGPQVRATTFYLLLASVKAPCRKYAETYRLFHWGNYTVWFSILWAFCMDVFRRNSELYHCLCDQDARRFVRKVFLITKLRSSFFPFFTHNFPQPFYVCGSSSPFEVPFCDWRRPLRPQALSTSFSRCGVTHNFLIGLFW